MNSDSLPFGREFLPLHQHDSGWAGIMLVHQKLQQLLHLTVAQNMFLGHSISSSYSMRCLSLSLSAIMTQRKETSRKRCPR